MTSNFKKWLSALLALLMVMTPITASLAEDDILESVEIEEPTPVEIAPEPDPVQPEVVSETEELIPEEEMQPAEDSEEVVESIESEEEQLPDADAQEEASGEESEESQEQAPSEDEAAPVEEEHPIVAEPVYATFLDASGVISPVYVSYGTQESELPLPSELPAEFSDGSAQVVPVTWFCSGNTYDGQGYIAECEDREVVFYFQATPVGILCSPSMPLPAVTVMYEPLPEPAAIDHEGISFAGTDMLIANGATVSIDDILNETGYDPSYRIVNEGGTIVAGESGATLENPVRLANGGAIKGGAYSGSIEIAGGSIADGSFSGRIECERGNINGGVFYGSIGGPGRQIYAIINGGEFHGDIGDSEYDGYIFIHGGDFYCNIKCRNLITDGDSTFYNADGEGGERKTVTLGTVGNIAGGIFYADVLNRSNITGGVFYGKVTNGGSKTNCNVLGGDFYGEFDNSVGGKVFTYGTYGGARFLDKASLTNRTVLDAGDDIYFSDEMVVTNESVGVIESGNYPCKVINYGTIAGGNFAGGVINMGTICGGALNGEIFNEGGTIAGAKINGMLMSNTGNVQLPGVNVEESARTVIISSDTKVSIEQILQLIGEGDASLYTVKNEGTITGDAAYDELPCNFDNTSLGNIEGGKFSGRVYAGTISDGTFSGEVHATNIEGGTFEGIVGSTMSRPATISNGTFENSVCADMITGGTFNAMANADKITGGTFNKEVNANMIIGEGTFSGTVTVPGQIAGGTFKESCNVMCGTIAGGTFKCPISSIGRKDRVDLAGLITIYGGTFEGGVATGWDDGIVIKGGTFNCNVGCCVDASKDIYDGYVLIRKPGESDKSAPSSIPEPQFNGEYVGGRNVVVEWGNFSEHTKVVVYTVGQIVDGTFNGPVICHNIISGGTFKGKVTMCAGQNGQVIGDKAKFEGGDIIIEAGANVKTEASKIAFQMTSGSIENNGGLDLGAEAELGAGVSIVNSETGNIKSGVYNGPVVNYGAMSGGVFKAPVTTYSSIAASGATFGSALMNVPTQELTIDENATMSIEEIKDMEGYSEDVRIINRGKITGDGELPNTITLIGNYAGGKVQGGVIEGGTFTGEIQSYYGMITGGTFRGNVVAVKGISAEAKGALHIDVEQSKYTTLVITIAGGTFEGKVGEKGTGHVTIYGNGDDTAPVFSELVAARNLNIEGGVFNGEVELSTVGRIMGGKFYGKVTCNNIIEKGEFFAEVEVGSEPNGQIMGGTFHKGAKTGTTVRIAPSEAEDEESGDMGAVSIAFDGGEIDNEGTMDPTNRAVFTEGVTVVNQKSGNILSGVYRGPVRNYGTISNAVLYGDVENEGRIVNSIMLGNVTGNGLITIQGVDLNENGIVVVEENETVQASAIKDLLRGETESDIIVINKGTIADDIGTTLDCTIIGGAIQKGAGGIITGGTYTGTVYAKTIKGGTFSGEVHNLCRETYAELPAKARNAAQAAFQIGDLRGGDANNTAVLYGLTITGGTFTNKIGNDGMDEAIIIRDGDFSGCDGIQAYNLVVSGTPEFGENCSVDFIVGNIAGGTFKGAVTNRNNTTGGTFKGLVTNNGTIFGGTFEGGIENNGTISGGETFISDWEFDSVEQKWVPAEPHEQSVTESDLVLDCTVTNNQGGVIRGTVKAEDGYSLEDNGGKVETSALVATPKGTSKIYSGDQVVCGAPVLDTLSAIDEAEHLTSEWSYLSGAAISPSATISADASKNAFLRTVTWDIRNGELQLGMDWSEATEVPDAEYSSVRILESATVSGGVWNVPVINEGTITGGTFNKALTNRGSVSGATINAAVTAEAGSIEGCTYGSSASVAKVAEGARVNATINVNGRDRAAAYGAKALDVLNAIETRSGYEWRSIGGAEKAVEAADTIPLSGGRYELKKRPVPEIIWPTASPIGVDAPLSSSKLTSADENGTFRWKYPTSTEKSTGTKQSAVIFTPNKDNPYNYSGIETTKLIPVQIRNDIITIDVSSGVHYKYYSNDDPTNLSVKVTGFRSATDKSKLKYRFVREPGEDVGTYELKVEVTSQPANYTFNIIPGTFEIRPKVIQGEFFRVTMKGVSYTGEELSPVPEVKDLLENRELEYGKDFTVSFDKPVLESGVYAFTVNGIGNYTGSKRGELSVGLGNAVVTIDSYTKTYGDPDPEFTSTCTGVSEKAGLQYEVTRMPGEDVGTYSITAKKLAGDSVAINQKGGGMLKIVPKQLPADIAALGEQPYNGKPIEPKLVVTDEVMGESVTLVEGTDYTLSYENNVKVGTATVVVTGKGNYTGTQRASFAIGKGNATLTIDSATKSINGKDPQFTAQATGLAAGDKLNYTLKCAHDEAVGEYQITAELGDNPNYNVTVIPGTLEITLNPEQIQLSADALELTDGERGELSYALLPEGTQSTVTYSSSDAKVARVDADGRIEALKPGAITITATTANGKTDSCELTVRPVPEDISIGNGDKQTLVPSDATVKNYTFASSNAAIASVDAKGVVTAKKEGGVTITASSGGVALSEWDVDVTAAPKKVTLSAAKSTMGVGDTLKLEATLDQGVSDITWTTSSAKIATVENGVVTAVKAGSATITATTYNKKVKATCKVTVKKAATSIKLGVTSAELGCGETLALKPTLSPNNTAGTITYESTDEGIAKVVDGAVVAGDRTGTATITAKLANGNGTPATCTVKVMSAPTKISLGEAVTLSVGQTLTLNPTVEPSGAKNAVTYSTSNKKFATVTAQGVVKAVKAGSATITAKSYNGVEGSLQINIVAAPSKVKMSATSASLGVGETISLSATVTGGLDGKVSWSSSNEKMATVDEEGNVTIGEKTGTVTITAKTYNNKKTTCKITVSAAPTSIALNLSNVVMGVGESAKQLKVTLSKKTASTITYDYDDSVISLENGKIVPKAPGTTTIKASTFNGLSAECEVTVYAAPTSVELGEDQSLKVKGTLTLQPQFGSGEGGTVTYKTSNKNVATVDATGKVTAKKAGTVKITVTTYNKKTDTVTITVTK